MKLSGIMSGTNLAATTVLSVSRPSPSSVEPVLASSPPSKLRHFSSTSTRSSNSTSSSFDDFDQNRLQPNDVILDHNQAIAIEVPASTLKIDLAPFKPASEVHPEPGDIVEFDRILFSEWAIYVGDGDVAQFVVETQDTHDSEMATVQRVPLTTMAGENYCRVNNKVYRARERNMLPFHNEIVVRKALSKVGSTVPYNVLQCNSEHYVTEWKYGQRWSDQVSLNSFGAFRQHTNSLSESHTMFVNTLNEVLNSPAICSNTSPGLTVTGPSTSNASGSSSTCTSAPINIQRPRNGRSGSISSAGHSPPGLGTSQLATRLSSSFNTAGVQTELSLL